MMAKYKRFLWLILPVVGIIAGYLLMARPVTLSIDGESQTVTTRALTVRGVLRSAGIRLSEDDAVTPAGSAWVDQDTKITYMHTGLVRLWLVPEGRIIPVITSATTPAEIVTAAGFTPGEHDTFKVNGLAIKADEKIDLTTGSVLQFTPAVSLSVWVDGTEQTITSSSPSLGKALWDAGIEIRSGDVVEPPLTTALEPGMQVAVTRGVPLEIRVDGKTLLVNSTALTVGDALQLAGIALQDMDYSQPAETEPLPADGKIDVLRVTEEKLVEQSTIPFTIEYVGDASMELDQTEVLVEGAYGLQAKTVRVRYENGVEVGRTNEGISVLKQPVNQQVAYGTQIVYRTLNTPDGLITYYRAITVTATSYSPCNLGVSWCNNTTASGTTVHRGIVAVHLDWYRILKGTQMYIPGYGIGTVADTGVYPYNHNWVDLGFTDEEFELYGKFYPSITIYLMAPAPANVPGIMP
jgi:uncharacterized protein YabE (DUF348 family)